MSNSIPIVAIVENDFGILKAAERLLGAFGYLAEAYTSAESYLQRNAHSKVDCLVLDINLDGMSGLELQKQLIKRGNVPPTIFITGRGDESTIAQAIDQGCIAFLHKPFDSHSLQTAIRAALHQGTSYGAQAID